MKTVGEFIAEWKIYGDDKEFVAALNAFQAQAFSDGLRSGADLVRLLDDCDAAMTAAAVDLWNQHRDLALQLTRLAARCRVEAMYVQPNAPAQRPPAKTHEHT